MRLSPVEMIITERLRQVEQEGFTPAHDDKHHINGELDAAAACYALAASLYRMANVE